MITQSSSEQSICFVVPTLDAPAVVRQIEEELALEIMRGEIDGVYRQDEVAIVAVVGAGMRGQPGIAAQVFGALAEQSINIISIAQGSSEYNLSLVLTQRDVNPGVRAIHQQFGLGAVQATQVKQGGNLSMEPDHVGVLGATGAVGQRFIQLLASNPWFRITALAASERSVGKRYADACAWRLSADSPEQVRDLIVQPCEPGLECRIVFSALPAGAAHADRGAVCGRRIWRL